MSFSWRLLQYFLPTPPNPRCSPLRLQDCFLPSFLFLFFCLLCGGTRDSSTPLMLFPAQTGRFPPAQTQSLFSVTVIFFFSFPVYFVVVWAWIYPSFLPFVHLVGLTPAQAPIRIVKPFSCWPGDVIELYHKPMNDIELAWGLKRWRRLQTFISPFLPWSSCPKAKTLDSDGALSRGSPSL